jgi:predicted aspartyl protease
MMLSHYLHNAIADLKRLIAVTREDIDAIKQANHSTVSEHSKEKAEILTTFENKKTLIDNEIVKLVSSNPDKELVDLLSEEQHQLLDDLKDNLETLRTENKRYAKMVLVVSEFYNSLLGKILPTEMDGYSRVNVNKSSYLQVHA